MRQTLSDTINRAIFSFLNNVYTAMPGIIQSYDPTKKKAEIKPAIKKNAGNESLSYPIITDVPVIFPANKDGGIIYSISAGDGCLLIFSCESMENYLSSKILSEVEPGDKRKFSLTDAICIPGLFTFGNPGKTSTITGSELIYKTFKVTLDLTGITLNSNDASIWQPNILPNDPLTGLPHGGVGGGIIKLRGA